MFEKSEQMKWQELFRVKNKAQKAEEAYIKAERMLNTQVSEAIALAEKSIGYNASSPKAHEVLGFAYKGLALSASNDGHVDGENSAKHFFKKAVLAFKEACNLGSKKAAEQLNLWNINMSSENVKKTKEVTPWILACENCQRKYILGINGWIGSAKGFMSMGVGGTKIDGVSSSSDLVGSSSTYLTPPENLDQEQLYEHSKECKDIFLELNESSWRTWTCNTCKYSDNIYPELPSWYLLIIGDELRYKIVMSSIDSDEALNAVKKIKDERLLKSIVLDCKNLDLAKEAVTIIRDPQLLKEIAINSKSYDVVQNAVRKIDDQEVLLEIVWSPLDGNIAEKIKQGLESLDILERMKWDRYHEMISIAINRLSQPEVISDIALNHEDMLCRFCAAEKVEDVQTFKTILLEDKVAYTKGCAFKSPVLSNAVETKNEELIAALKDIVKITNDSRVRFNSLQWLVKLDAIEPPDKMEFWLCRLYDISKYSFKSSLPLKKQQIIDFSQVHCVKCLHKYSTDKIIDLNNQVERYEEDRQSKNLNDQSRFRPDIEDFKCPGCKHHVVEIKLDTRYKDHLKEFWSIISCDFQRSIEEGMFY